MKQALTAWSCIVIVALLLAAGAADARRAERLDPQPAAPAAATAPPLPTIVWENPRAPGIVVIGAGAPAPAPATAEPEPAPAVVASRAGGHDLPDMAEPDSDAAPVLLVFGPLNAPSQAGPALAQGAQVSAPALGNPGLLVIVGLVGAGALAVAMRIPERARRPKPGFASAQEALRAGQAAIARRDTHAALAAFQNAAQLAPETAIARLCEGLCLADLGRHDEAREALRVALDADPADGIARLHFARACARTGSTAEAMSVVGPLLEACPELAPSVADDPAFATLADHPMFLQMVGRL